MTKAATKGARRRRKKGAGITMPGGEIAPIVSQQGRRTDREDARRLVMSARVRHGVAQDDAPTAMAGCPVGRCILHFAEQAKRPPLWQTWQSVSASRRNYRLMVLGQSGMPSSGQLQMVPERMEADTWHAVDIRAVEERIADARRAEAQWTARIKALPAPQFIWAIRNALNEREDAVWADGQPTDMGRVVVLALGHLTAQA